MNDLVNRTLVVGITLGAIAGIVLFGKVVVTAMGPNVALARLSSPEYGVLIVHGVEYFDTLADCIARREVFPKPQRAELECLVSPRMKW